MTLPPRMSRQADYKAEAILGCITRSVPDKKAEEEASLGYITRSVPI